MADVPLFPSIHSRYFNGRIAARLTIEHGEFKLQNFDVESNGKQLPWLFTGQSYDHDLYRRQRPTRWGFSSCRNEAVTNAEPPLTE